MRNAVRAIGGIVAIGLCLTTSAVSPARAQSVTRTELAAATGAYIELLYESHILDEISSKYPGLAPRVDAARAAFSAKFGTAVASISTELSDHAPEAAATAAQMAQDLMKKDPVSDQSSAETELTRYEGFAKGDIDPPALRATLLFWQYRENPIDEISNGYVASFVPTAPSSTVGLAIRYPMSWKLSDSTPALPGMLISDNGKGVAALNFSLLGGHQGALTAAEIQQVFPGVGDIKFSDGEIAGYPANTATAKVEDTRNGSEFADRIQVDSIHAGSTWLYVTSTIVLARIRSGEIDLLWTRYAPVFDAVRKSIKVTPGN
jgi:hypothetical protein